MNKKSPASVTTDSLSYSKAVWDNHITAGMMILGIIASLYFMWEQRQAKTE